MIHALDWRVCADIIVDGRSSWLSPRRSVGSHGNLKHKIRPTTDIATYTSRSVTTCADELRQKRGITKKGDWLAVESVLVKSTGQDVRSGGRQI